MTHDKKVADEIFFKFCHVDEKFCRRRYPDPMIRKEFRRIPSGCRYLDGKSLISMEPSVEISLDFYTKFYADVYLFYFIFVSI